MRIHKEDQTAAIAFLYNYGHLQFPNGVEQDIPEVLTKLKPSARAEFDKVKMAVHKSGLSYRDPCVQKALLSYQVVDEQFDLIAPAVHDGKQMDVNGEMGPATEFAMNLPRCGHPDHSPPADIGMAVGRGNWPRCHGVGDYHAVSVKIANSPPSFLAPHFEEVKKRVTEAYAEVGLLIHWDGRSPVNIDFSFVNRSSGWIGLAIVGQNQGCNSRIWCRYLASYRGGSSAESIIQQWTTLIKHELGHNTGMSHFRGGVMNPSIVNGLPTSFRGDPTFNTLTSKFGGERVPTGPEDNSREMWLAWKYADGKYEDITRIRTGSGDVGGWPT